MKKVIEYPSWHDDARKAYAKGGKTYAQIADEFGFVFSRAGHILGPNWKIYLLVYRKAFRDRPDLSISRAEIDSGKVSFVPVLTPSPKQAEADVKASKRNPRPFVEEDPMARARTFTEVKDFADGKILKGALITCYKCEGTEKYFNFQGSVSTEHLPKEFARRGWLVGKNERTDMCPSCLSKLRGPKPKQEDFPVFTTPVPVTGPLAKDLSPSTPQPPVAMKVFAEPAKSLPPVGSVDEMDRTSRRLVFARLDELYGDEKTGYKDDWTDAKVATDLGVPIDWIAKVRDSDFGPETNASIASKKIDDVIKLGQAIDRHILLADKKIEQMQSLDQKITDAIGICNKAIDRFEELSKNLETEDGRIENILNAFNTDVAEFKKLYAELAASTSPK